MSRKIFSVVIPIYNCEKYLKYSVENVLKQTFYDIEIICIDDGSTDGTLSALNEYRKYDNRIKILHQKHLGAAAARNAGLKIAKGEYISFIDADDFVSRNLYQKIFNIVNKKSFDIILFNAGFYNNKLKSVSKRNFFNILNIKNHFDEFSQHTYKDFKYLFYEQESVANKIYKKSFIDMYNYKFDESSSFEDRLFHYKTILSANSISILNERLYLYRQYRKGSMNSKIFDKKSRIIFEVFDNITELEYLIFWTNSDLKERFFDFVIQILSDYFMRAPKKIKKEFYEKMQNKFFTMKYWNIDKSKIENSNSYKLYLFAQKHNYIGYLAKFYFFTKCHIV